MIIKWTETHEAEFNDDRIKEIFEEGKNYLFGGIEGLIAENLINVIYEVDRYNIYEKIPNWDEIVTQIYEEGRKKYDGKENH